MEIMSIKTFKNPRVWLHSLVAAAITGFAGAIAGAMVDPHAFNLAEWGPFLNLLKLGGAQAFIGVCAFLVRSPLPELVEKEADGPKPPVSTGGAAMIGGLLCLLALAGCATDGTNINLAEGSYQSNKIVNAEGVKITLPGGGSFTADKLRAAPDPEVIDAQGNRLEKGLKAGGEAAGKTVGTAAKTILLPR